MSDDPTRTDPDADDRVAPDDGPTPRDERRARHEAKRAARAAHRERSASKRRSRERPEPSTASDGVEPRPRRTQAERTAETTERILDATVACLADRGHAGASTTEICRRAGVSRGALLHHFATKDELLAAAVTHVFQRSVEEFRAQLREVPPGPDRLDAAIDVLWQIFRTETYDAWLELIVAGRTDRAIQRHVARETDALAAAVVEAWVELFPEAADREDLGAAPLLLFSLLEGLALNRHTGSTSIEDAVPEVLATLKATAHLLLAPRPATHDDDTHGGAR